MPITPAATMTSSYRKALTKYITDGTSLALTTFVFGSGGSKNDIATKKGNITSGSEIVTAVSDFSNLKLTQPKASLTLSGPIKEDPTRYGPVHAHRRILETCSAE